MTWCKNFEFFFIISGVLLRDQRRHPDWGHRRDCCGTGGWHLGFLTLSRQVLPKNVVLCWSSLVGLESWECWKPKRRWLTWKSTESLWRSRWSWTTLAQPSSSRRWRGQRKLEVLNWLLHQYQISQVGNIDYRHWHSCCCSVNNQCSSRVFKLSLFQVSSGEKTELQDHSGHASWVGRRRERLRRGRGARRRGEWRRKVMAGKEKNTWIINKQQTNSGKAAGAVLAS